MAFWTCGWELGSTTAYTNQGFLMWAGSLTTDSTYVHKSVDGNGGSYAWVQNTDTYLYSPMFGTGGRWFHGWYRAGSTPHGVTFMRNGGATFSVQFEAGGMIHLRRGNTAATVVAYGTYNPNIPHWVAIEANIASSGGQVTLFIDGVQVVQYTGDTAAQSTDDWDAFLFTGWSGNGQSWDDIVITTAAEGRLDEYFIPPMIPGGNDSIQSDSGTYTNVNAVPPDANYNEFTSVGAGKTDRYTTTNLTWTPVDVHCVTVLNYGARDGTVAQAQTVCATDTGGGGPTEALGTATGPSSAGSYAGWLDVFNVDPNTAAAWTAAGLNDLRIGVKYV